MDYMTVIGVMALFLLVLILVIQLQINALSKKIEEKEELIIVQLNKLEMREMSLHKQVEDLLIKEKSKESKIN